MKNSWDVEREIHSMNGQPKNLQQLHNDFRISQESFLHLVESMPQRIPGHSYSVLEITLYTVANANLKTIGPADQFKQNEINYQAYCHSLKGLTDTVQFRAVYSVQLSNIQSSAEAQNCRTASKAFQHVSVS